MRHSLPKPWMICSRPLTPPKTAKDWARPPSGISSLRRDWGSPVSQDSNDYSLAVYQAQIMAALLRVKGVFNVTGLTLNGQAADIMLTQNAQTQQLPKLGVVSLE